MRTLTGNINAFVTYSDIGPKELAEGDERWLVEQLTFTGRDMEGVGRC